ncbi:hypothetical protein [Paenibacillus sp. GCM10027626]|uniref:hypothetical protein n=1 Tax=Paenibacillus sp. GCM10027626 TaxID=3273411 RepID=UPI003642263C
MNYKLKNIALSALLLSAVAVPVSANAAPPVSAVQALPAKAVVYQFTDPLEIAKKYAPDTVADWEKTLAAYQKLTGSEKGAVTQLKKVMLKREDVPGEIGAASATVSSIAATIETGDKIASRSKEHKVEELNMAPLPVNTQLVKVKHVSGNGDVAPEASLKIEAIAAAKPPKIASPFIEAQIALSEAVNAKDADAAEIKTRLAALLDQYKQEFASLTKS